MIIKDTDGKAAGVNSDGRLKTSSISSRRDFLISRDDGMAFVWQSVNYDYVAADTILLVKNTSASLKLCITAITILGDVASDIVIHATTATTPTGTAVTGVNMNQTSSNPAPAIAKAAESTNAQGTVIHSTKILASTPYTKDFGGVLILGENDCIAVDIVTEGTAALVSIEGFFDA